ncbi:MAG TPA: serine hydroxymethyltransferase [Candidatus Saccharimonadales bacterium]|nr:serine hydroxymethyltransferase [Candidatus Saccharimonadales bacterium]
MKRDILFDFLAQEEVRQQEGINLIASENYVSPEILAMTGSVLTNKYVEGNVGARYYSGCQFVDEIEQETINRFKTLFHAEHANVQPHSGTQANFAVYYALLNPGDTILSMKLNAGGHLTHGHSVNLSGKLYTIVSYGVDEKTGLIDYDVVEQLAMQHKPKLIIAGASSYSRIIDFERFAKIAQKVGAYFLADIAHIAGLVAVGLHPSPFPWADCVTMTTHKTFRGPRGAVILCKKEFAQNIDRAVMPGIQGGAFMNVIAAKGVACMQAMQSEFKTYQQQVIQNAQTMARVFKDQGYTIISGGTDTHLFLIDVRPLNLTGKHIEEIFESVGIYVNRNAIPYDTNSPLVAGGIRIGTAAITTRGATQADCGKIAQLMCDIITAFKDGKDIHKYSQAVKEITNAWQKKKDVHE